MEIMGRHGHAREDSRRAGQALRGAAARRGARVRSRPGRDLAPGGEGRLTFDDRATSQRMAVRLQVQAAEPPHRFSFRWDHPDGAQPHVGNARWRSSP
jgi:uncharacterized protein YndB with AHSA1/START domain